MEIEKQRRAVRAQPRSARAHAMLGLALQQAGQLAEAVHSQRRALKLNAQLPGVHAPMAGALYQLGRYQEAAASYQLAVQQAPAAPELHMALGETLFQLRQFGAAAASFSQAVALAPGDVNGLCWLAEALREQGDFQGALDAYRRVQALEPDNVRALRDLGLCLYKVGQLTQARDAVKLALVRFPDHPVLLWHLLMIELDDGEADAALEVAARFLGAGPQDPAAHTTALFTLSHFCLDPAALTKAHLGYAERWERALRALRAPHANVRDPHRVLRVGFVSGDLYSHAVANFLAPITSMLRHSDQLELFAYCNNSRQDDATRQLREHFAHWRDISGMDDAHADQLIRKDGIDILIDLSGHTLRNRLPLFARKPAPVQASWIGYGGSTGLEAMDYYLSDPFHLPRGRYDDQFTEKIVHLPSGFAFLPDQNAPPLTPLPALDNGYLSFGSFHRANKLTRPAIAQWAQLLRALPSARLVLGGQTGHSADKPLAWLEAEGIARDRISVKERTSMRGFLTQLQEVDVCLAPLPYTGATTIFHALWMGVPTLATVGATNPSHAVAQPLGQLGLSSFIADSDQAYVMLGQFVAQNLPVLAQLRAGMRERFMQSVLGHPNVIAAGLERGLRLMWLQWCAGLAPAPLEVRLADLTSDALTP